MFFIYDFRTLLCGLLLQRSGIDPFLDQFKVICRKIEEVLFTLDLDQQACGGIIRDDHCAALTTLHQVGICRDLQSAGSGITVTGSAFCFEEFANGSVIA